MLRIAVSLVSAFFLLGSAPPGPSAPTGSKIDRPVHDEVALGTDRRKRLTVPVTIDGQGPFTFVVDTGAQRTIVSSNLAKQLDLKPAPSAVIHSVTGPRRVPMVHLPDMRVSTDGIDGTEVPVLSQANIGADGIVGIDSLQRSKVSLDIKDQNMTVRPSYRSRTPRTREGGVITVTAKSKLGRLIITDARINGKKVRIIVDTGAEISIGNMALRRVLLGRRSQHANSMITVHGVTGQSMKAELGWIQELDIGPLELENALIAFADAHAFHELGLVRRPALLLGMNVMRAFDEVEIDFANRRVGFTIPGRSHRNDIDNRYAAASK